MKINREMSCPKKLYRYRPINKFTFNEIFNQHIYLAKTSDFDDIYDGRFLVNDNEEMEGRAAAYYFTKICQNQHPELKKSFENYEERNRQDEELIDRNIKIACFTENDQNIPMWYYYADKHQGICIEYDMEDNENKAEVEKRILLPAVYDSKLDYYDICRYRTEREREITLLTRCLLKHDDWSFEKEWRLISELPETEWEKNPYCNLKMNAICFGLNVSADMKEVIKACIQSRGFNIALYQMKQDITGLVKERYI